MRHHVAFATAAAISAGTPLGLQTFIYFDSPDAVLSRAAYNSAWGLI
jgi:hypothetical protein